MPGNVLSGLVQAGSFIAHRFAPWAIFMGHCPVYYWASVVSGAGKSVQASALVRPCYDTP